MNNLIMEVTFTDENGAYVQTYRVVLDKPLTLKPDMTIDTITIREVPKS